MMTYWLWLLFNVIIWLFSLIYFNQSIEEMAVVLFGTALYFAIFFFLPLVKRKPKMTLSLLCINAIIAIATFFPDVNRGFNPYIILILTLLIGEGLYRLSLRYSLVLGGIIATGLITANLRSDLLPIIQICIVIYMSILFTAMVYYKKTKDHTDDLEVRYDTLLNEYRNMKRRIVSEEALTRQEERMLIAHEIHDSVGHKLTALLMQLEVFRIHASEQDKSQVQSLKELASASLEETRSAVRSIKTNEPGGLPGILRLIRKLEMENYMRIHFSVKHGAFTAPLTGEQSFVIYRSVQEALTNIMKHSHTREAEIMFEAPGGSIFRFEISNPVTDNNRYQEGFGLTSMRERLEKLGGNLDVYKTEEQFIVSGFLRIGYGGLG
ncbi:sensor histidine kinase [Paenibacillus crassostreae]|uniref:histidine kinase n=1 Tax=Paenibacillus crassostreae TaxID=1763538 RepID=A0A167BC94_9BACL|nr:sensor histidine kinase [Paenibacillus crassostreae]AOZ92973.1 histidine kinase [Paenibacillus crassostreae]OAB71938.1 histidine kinase [Paenibacillus crassostreae]